jgi:hypothetical protein
VTCAAIAAVVMMYNLGKENQPYRVVDTPAPTTTPATSTTATTQAAPGVKPAPPVTAAPVPPPVTTPVPVQVKPASGSLVLNRGRIATASTAVGQRDVLAESIRVQLDEQLGGHWLVLVLIPETPEPSPTEGRDGWVWSRCSTTLVVVGDGKVAMPVATDDLCRAVYDLIADRVRQPTANLRVSAELSTDPKQFAAMQIDSRTLERAELARRTGGAEKERLEAERAAKELKAREENERVRRVVGGLFPLLP